ncbi:MAG: hypothetical protein IPF72_13775 [Chitinophagaceae bacterium]|nr:hypothetical protein [Chitinophagaceae bacterium]
MATGCFTNASVLVNYTPPAPTITPSSVTMCLGDPAVKLKATSSSSGTVTVNSGTLALAIPDGPCNMASNFIPWSCYTKSCGFRCSCRRNNYRYEC